MKKQELTKLACTVLGDIFKISPEKIFRVCAALTEDELLTKLMQEWSKEENTTIETLIEQILKNHKNNN
jgi:KaiC/GvpD/RAD55 family RecA-like ATPase